VITLSGARDANITGATVDSFPPGTYGLVINVFSGTQAIVDFSLSSIPPNATVSSLLFSFDESSYANANGLVSVYGYGRSGAIVPADATASATQLGSYASVAMGLGPHSIPLNSAADAEVQSLLGGSKDLGLRFTSSSSDTNTSFGSVELTDFTPPSVLVTYSVPEPSSAALLVMAGFVLLRRPCVRIRETDSGQN